MNDRLFRQQLPKLELDKNRRRVKECPCGKNNKDGKFVPYVNYEDKGYCHACGEVFLPPINNDYYQSNPRTIAKEIPQTVTKNKPDSFIPFEFFSQSLRGYHHNSFCKYLESLFGLEILQELIYTYYIGTSKYWNGATIFWQIDKRGNIRTGKIMLYDPETGKRKKEPFNHINWVHNVTKIEEFHLKQCFFGEHLLSRNTDRPVAIVESEKTAIISSVYLPMFSWLAVGSVSNLTIEKCSMLKGRRVVLFPDLNAYQLWKKKHELLAHDLDILISDYLEIHATEIDRNDGLDIADYLIKYNLSDFDVH